MPARLLVPLALLAACFAAHAADPFYLGTWKVTATAAAPWSTRENPPEEHERKELMGKTVVFKPNEIAGPRQVACKGPQYRVKDYPADMLFQGMFGEMHERDKSVDPNKEAAKAGFMSMGAKATWKTVETGCPNEVDWHFIDPLTTTFGLNNVIYTLTKQ